MDAKLGQVETFENMHSFPADKNLVLLCSLSTTTKLLSLLGMLAALQLLSIITFSVF